jgi:DNA-binding NarL/FixJ family response regulator
MQFSTVLVLDDHPLLATALVGSIQEVAPKARYFTATKFAEAQKILATHSADLIFADIGLPDSQGAQIVSNLRLLAPTAVIAIFTAQRDRKLAFDCLDRGAMAFVCKNDSAVELKRALKLLMAGKVYLSTEAMLSDSQSTFEKPPQALPRAQVDVASEGLSPRQHEVFQLMVRGLSNQTIADRLEISVPTTKIHAAAVLHHFEVSNRVQLLVKVAEKLSFPALPIG